MFSSTPIKSATIDSTDSSSTTTKYGDSDLASKRRKGSKDDEDDDAFGYESIKDVSNPFPDHSDFKGGFLKDYVSASNKQNDPSFVSSSPSGTSCGFENTFDILQDQIRAKARRHTYLRRISEEYVPSLISFMEDSSDSSNSMVISGDNDGPLTFFELKYEAGERILRDKRREILQKPRLNIDGGSGQDSTDDNSVSTPLNELLYDFKAAGLDVKSTDDSGQLATKEEIIIREEGDYPEYVYHIAKGKDGRKYLRVVRSLLIDKVLCGNRVSQMTRAYDDIEAVTRLLEEKEKDLELTVQIGKELLTQNNRLEKRIVDLEADLKKSNEERAQLAHDLHQKSELISVLTNDIDDGSENETPTASKSINLDLLQRKIANLQDENHSLKLEAHQLVKQTDEVEEQERKLMEDITTQLNSANSQFDGMSLELERQKEENRLQHEQILDLKARLTDAEMRLHQLTAENDEQVSLLSITKENQNMLTTELAEFKLRYQEVLALLQETQEQLRKQKKKSQPQVRSSFITGGGLGIPQPDSLHLELMESSLYSDNSLDSGISTDRMSAGSGHMPPFRKVFETVRCAAKNGHYSDGMSHLGAMSLSSSSQPRMSAMPFVPSGLSQTTGNYHRTSSVYSGSTYPSYDSSSMGIKTMSCESLTSSQSDDGYPTQPAGMPGAPGAKDLEAALKRLTPAEVLVRRTMLAHAPAGTYTYDENQHQHPLGIRTPDSIMSTGSSGQSQTSSNPWRLPDKLQIVKPMEGSQTLHHWSRLATPNLSGLLDERPGVTVRGGRGLEELGMQIYSLSDVEEDFEDYPGKQFQESGCVYTFTNSTVMHPDDGTAALLGLSVASSRIASNSTSRQSSCPPSPRSGLSRRNSCSTFSVNMGLASMLNERGIKAVTPSAINTPAGPNFSPTVTPCNSPEGSPTRSQSPEPLFGILSSGADLIRRKLIGTVERPTRNPKQQKIMLSRLEKRALRSLRLLEKVESVGLENIIAAQPNAMSQLSSGIASRSASPMAQLTSFKHLPTSSCSSSGASLDFNRDQIRAILTKGLSNDSLKSFTDSDLASSVSSSDDLDDISLYSPMISASDTTLVQQLPAAMVQPGGSSTPSAPAVVPTNPVADIRLKQMQRQKSRRNLKNGIGGQRPDLGTVGGRVRPDLGKVDGSSSMNKSSNLQRQQQVSSHHPQRHQQQQQQPEQRIDEKTTQSMTQSFVGSISSLFFGRKGGWL